MFSILADTFRIGSYFTLSRTEEVEERELLRSRSYGEVNEMLQTEFGRRDERTRREALQGAVMDVVRSRFPTTPDALEAQVRRIRSLDKLQELIRQAATATSLDEINAALG